MEPFSKGAKSIYNKWVCTNKTDSHCNLTRCCSRVVANGFYQRLGIDYKETFASVTSYSTLRNLLSIIASQNRQYLLLDVKSAFLNSALEGEMSMKQLEGFIDAELTVVQCACQARTRVQRSSSNAINNNNQQELLTAQPYGVSDSPFPFSRVCSPQ